MIGSVQDSFKHPYLEIVKGNVPGHRSIHKFGRNPTIGGATFEVVWNGGGQYTGFDATEAQICEVFSDDDDDTALGGGARDVLIQGLDANLIEQEELVQLAGTTPAETTKEYLRIYRAYVMNAGVSAGNVGDLTARQKTTTANIFMVMPPGYNQTMIAAYTVPLNTTGYIAYAFAAFTGNPASSSALRLKGRFPGSVFRVMGELSINASGSSIITREYVVPLEVPPGTDILIEANSSGTSIGVVAGFDLILVNT